MNSDSTLVDEIVRQVLRQLNGLPADLPARPAVPSLPPADSGRSGPAAASSPASTTDSPESIFPPRRDPGETGIGQGPAGRLLAPPSHFSAVSETLIGTVAETSPSAVTVVAPAAAPAHPRPTVTPSAAPAPVTPAARLVAGPSELRLAERVITGELLRRLSVGSVVRVSPRALLTPSARDAVASLKLQIVRESAGGQAPAGQVTSWLVLSAQPGTPLEALLPGWRSGGGRIDLRRTGTPAETAEQAVSALCRGEAQGVLVLSPEAEWVACLANRNERVRGASVATAANLGRLAAGLKFNLLTLDGRGVTAADWNSAWPALAGAAGGSA